MNLEIKSRFVAFLMGIDILVLPVNHRIHHLNRNPMPRQHSPLKLSGTLDDLSFYHNRKYGWLLRRTHRHDPERVRREPGFARTRQNAAEFGRVASLAGWLRRQIGPELLDLCDSELTNRLIRTLYRVMREDPLSAKGERDVIQGLGQASGRELLTGLELHATYPLHGNERLHLDPDSLAIGMTGRPGIRPAPAAATHYRLSALWVRLAPEDPDLASVRADSPEIPLDTLPEPFTLAPEALPPGEGPVLVFLFLRYVTRQNEHLYALREGAGGCVVGVAVTR